MSKSTEDSQADITSRRQFLKLGTCAGAMAIAPHLPGKSPVATAAPGAQKRLGREEPRIAKRQVGMRPENSPGRPIAEASLQRIDEMDKHGPAVNSCIELNPEALTIAEALDRERKEKSPRGPLHGIPVL